MYPVRGLTVCVGLHRTVHRKEEWRWAKRTDRAVGDGLHLLGINVQARGIMHSSTGRPTERSGTAHRYIYMSRYTGSKSKWNCNQSSHRRILDWPKCATPHHITFTISTPSPSSLNPDPRAWGPARQPSHSQELRSMTLSRILTSYISLPEPSRLAGEVTVTLLPSIRRLCESVERKQLSIRGDSVRTPPSSSRPFSPSPSPSYHTTLRRGCDRQLILCITLDSRRPRTAMAIVAPINSAKASPVSSMFTAHRTRLSGCVGRPWSKIRTESTHLFETIQDSRDQRHLVPCSLQGYRVRGYRRRNPPRALLRAVSRFYCVVRTVVA